MLTKNELKHLISEGKTKQVVQALLKAAQALGDNDLFNDVTHQSARFEQNKQEETLGVTNRDDLNRQLANIHQALLKIIDRLPDESIPQEPASGQANSKPFGTGEGNTLVTDTDNGSNKPVDSASWIVGLTLLVGILLLLVFVPCPTAAQFFAFRLVLALAAGGLATMLPGMFGWNLTNGIKATGAMGFVVLVYLVNPTSLITTDKCGNTPFEFTVSLQQDPAQVIPPTYPKLEQATLKIRLGNEWKPAEVDANGDADFKNIAGDYRDEKVAARLAARYWTLAADSVRLDGNTKSQTLRVKPDGSLGKISGKVMDAETGDPLVGATVEVLRATVASNETGNFEMTITPDKQRMEYEVHAQMKGYKPYTGNATPATSASVKILLERRK